MKDVKRSGALAHVEQEIFVGDRIWIHEVLQDEISFARHTWEGGRSIGLGTGTDGLTSETRGSVRCIVSSGKSVKLNLFVESFSWQSMFFLHSESLLNAY